MYMLVIGAVLCACWGFTTMWRHAVGKTGRLSDKMPPFFRFFDSFISFFSVFFQAPRPEQETPRHKKLALAIRQAAFHMRPEEVYAAQIIGGLIGLAFGGFMVSLLGDELSKEYDILIALVFGVICYFLPYAMVTNAAEKRKKTILSELPFAIDLITSSMDAGLDFGAAVRYLIDIVGRNVLNDEFAIFLKDVELGKTRSEALHAMDQRLAIKEFTRFVNAVAFGIESGTSIIDIMKIQVEEMRRVKFARAEEMAEKAPGKMMPIIILCMFPSFFIILGTAVYFSYKSSGGL